ncbi:hypothetical protein NFI96_008238 [Prochilodus magdalenae]|nr:hypothetical protein NFI96_008238 [Prochilodus magdalenae]
MAYFLFSGFTTFLHSPDGHLANEIRLSIFLIAGNCVGLPALAWALRALHRHRKNGGRISVLVIMLLLSDLLELLLRPYVVTKLLQKENCREAKTPCWVFISMWSGSMIYGLHLQQVVALEGALSLRHPHCSAHAFFPSCSIITSIAAFFCFFLFELSFGPYIMLMSLPLIVAVMLTFCTITCRAPPHIASIPYPTQKPSYTVFVFASFSMILHVLVILCTFIWNHWGLGVTTFCLMSLRVLLDPLMCVLVCKKNLRVQTPQTEVEPNTDIEVTVVQNSDTVNTDTAQL